MGEAIGLRFGEVDGQTGFYEVVLTGPGAPRAPIEIGGVRFGFAR